MSNQPPNINNNLVKTSPLDWRTFFIKIYLSGYIGFVTIGARDFRKAFFGVDDMAK